jgi:lysyl-tRNA synthetase class 2
MDWETVELRAQFFAAIREFFQGRNYTEVDTPVLCTSPIPESCLEVFKTQFLPPSAPERDLFLLPSPEFYMKKMISHHKKSIFQLCHSFRNCESLGRIHNIEFTMLEYYTINYTYKDSVALTEDLLNFLSHKLFATSVFKTSIVITMNEAFRFAVGHCLEDLRDIEAISKVAKSLNLHIPPEASFKDLYELVFVHCVEPKLGELGENTPVFLTDYPAAVPCLAKDAENPLYKERWELYINGMEIANCYTEETDCNEVKKFFESEKVDKNNARIPHPVDENYWEIFRNFPPCSGVALGVDRLFASFLGKKSIDGVTYEIFT